MTRAAFEPPVIDDLTDAFVADFERLTTIARTHGEAAYPPHEAAAFEHALTLPRSGAIGTPVRRAVLTRIRAAAALAAM